MGSREKLMGSHWKCSSNATLCQNPEECKVCSLNENCMSCRNRDRGVCTSCKNYNYRESEEGVGIRASESTACDAAENELFSEHGKYVIQFARNHGISISEAYGHPMVKAHKEALQHLNECRAFAAGDWFIPGA